MMFEADGSLVHFVFSGCFCKWGSLQVVACAIFTLLLVLANSASLPLGMSFAQMKSRPTATMHLSGTTSLSSYKLNVLH